MNKENRVYQIDLFRFLAALSVVFYHYLFRGHAADDKSKLVFSEIGHFFKYNYLGVEFFFIISGFVIALSIKHNSLVKFIISRISRLYPVYWISVCSTFLVIIFFGAPRFTADLKQFIFNLTMFQNYISGIQNIDGVYWTLFIEMKFYICIGIYLFLNRIKSIKFDYLIYFWVLITLFYLFFSSLYILRVLDYFLIFKWSSYFIAGMVFYQIYKNKITYGYVFVLLISLGISIYYAIKNSDYLAVKFNTSYSPYIVGTIIFSFYIIMLLVSLKKLNRLNTSKFIGFGLLTYPLYLLHQNIGYIIFNNLAPFFNPYVIVFFTILLMLFLSYIISDKFEPKIASFIKSRLEYFAKNKII